MRGITISPRANYVMEGAMTSNEAKVIIALFTVFAVMMIAVALSDAYTSTPRQYGDKVCVKVLKELKCEPIDDQ